MLAKQLQQQWLLPLAVQPKHCWTRLLKAFTAYSTGQVAQKKPYISQKVKFIDQLRVVARGGQGGGGSSALFGRTGHHPRAAGGNGAPGGSVVLRATRQLTGLGSIPLHVEAERGGHGGKQWMDGKKGADRVVQVPLGTMVWRLVQLRGPGAARPHGVTPLATAAGQHSSHLQGPVHESQQQQDVSMPLQQGACDASGSSTPHLQQPSQQGTASSSSSNHQQRRRLFQGDQLEPAQAELAAAAVPSLHGGERAAAGSPARGSGSEPSSNSSDIWHTQDAETDTDQGLVYSLYDDLIHCRMALSNQQKLQLLHYGSLDGPAVGLVDWVDSSEADEYAEADTDQDDVGGCESEYGNDSEADAGPGGDVRGLGEHGAMEGRHFTKQQVWSVLSAQAELIGVLECEGQELLVAAGGRGGRGNAAAHSHHQRPASKVRSDGQPGQEVLLMLQLRLMADVALVGLPNVGKSSLIAALTGARAQVGSYAFTTLRPQLGALLETQPDAEPHADQTQQAEEQQQSGTKQQSHTATPPQAHSVLTAAATATAGDQDSGLAGHRLVLADLPGLVPGAHEGRGRGIDFLKHLLKARCVALVVDMTGRPAGSSHAGNDSTVDEPVLEGAAVGQQQGDDVEALVPHSPEQQLNILLDELRCFDPKTMSMPMLVVANKVDAMTPASAAAALQRLKAATGLPIIPVSAQQHLGLSRLKQSLELIAGTATMQS